MASAIGRLGARHDATTKIAKALIRLPECCELLPGRERAAAARQRSLRPGPRRRFAIRGRAIGAAQRYARPGSPGRTPLQLPGQGDDEGVAPDPGVVDPDPAA